MTRLAQIACPSCGAGNRIAASGAPAAARCGRCHAALFSGAPLDVDDAALANHLQLTKGLIVLDVWAPWCAPCRMMAPHFATAAQRFQGKAVFLKMNADQCATPQRLGARSIPALFLFADGKPVANRSGLMTAEALAQWIETTRSRP